MESFRKHDVYEKIWDLYKHTDSVRAQKEEAIKSRRQSCEEGCKTYGGKANN